MFKTNRTTKEASETNRKENENLNENYHLLMSDVQQFLLIATLINNLQSYTGNNFLSNFSFAYFCVCSILKSTRFAYHYKIFIFSAIKQLINKT